MNQSNNETNVFICYSRKEENYKDEIVTHLKGALNTGLKFSYWVDDKLKSGDLFKEEIIKNLGIANIAIFILSANFLASEFIQTVELPTLLKNASEKGTRFLIVVARRCHYKNTILGKYQTVKPNTPDHPLNQGFLIKPFAGSKTELAS